MLRTVTIAAIACFHVMLAAGCSDSNMIGPSNQPEVTNATDNFQFQASNLARVSQLLTYTWTNTGTQANIDQSGAIADGTAVLVLRDGAGTEVFRRSLRDTGSFASTSGASGNWRIEVRLDDVDGTVNFRVQKP